MRGLELRVIGAAVVALCCACVATADDVDPRRPTAISVENVPPVPEEIFERQRQYQNVRQATFLGFAPDGQSILIATRFGNSNQLHKVYQPGGRREQITFFDEPTTGRFIPGADDGAMLAVLSRGGDENDQIYLVEPKTGQTTLLTDGKSRNLLGPLRRDGLAMIVHSNRRNGRDTDLYVASCRRPDDQTMLLEVDGQHWIAQDWSKDGKRLALLRYVSVNEAYPAVMEVETRELRELELPDGVAKAAVGAMRFAPDGRSVWLTTDTRREYLELAHLNLETGEYTWPIEPRMRGDVDGLEVDPRTGNVAFTTNDGGVSRLLTLVEGKMNFLSKLPMGVVGGMDFSPDNRTLGFTLAVPEGPAEAYTVDVRRLEPPTRWTFSEVGGLNPKLFVAPSIIGCPSFDSHIIPAFYYCPRGASSDKPAPVLIQIHGGPESQYRPIFSGLIQYWVNDLGLAVVCPNVRGSAGYGKTYLQLDNGPLREDAVKDIGAVLDWIAKQPELDKSRVGVTGGSYGGFMVLASLAMHGDRLRAGMDHVGIANFITFLEQTSPYRQDLRRAEYGDERDPAMRAIFERINPTSKTDQIKSALLVAHGENDPRVPIGEARQIAEAVRAAGRPVWTIYAANEGHGFAKKDNRDYLTAVEALFLQQNLIDAGK